MTAPSAQTASPAAARGPVARLWGLLLVVALLAPSAPAATGAAAATAAVEPGPTAPSGWFRPALDSAVGSLLAAIEAWAPTEPEVRTIRLRPRPKPGPFAMNLYSEGDFVSQQTRYWCIAAATQTMINIIEPGAPNRSKARQRRLHFQARELDDRWDWFWAQVAGQERWDRGLHGLGIRDWAGLLEANGHGPYVIERAPTRKQAIRMAARAIRLTGRPAGLVVWRGAHAWVMSGFRATADPAYTDSFSVRQVIVSDPWYPSVSSIWGPSRPPNSAVPVRALAADYLPYDRPGRRHPKRDGKYMLILPALPPGTAVR